MKKILLLAVLLGAASAALRAQPMPQYPPGWEELENRARLALSQNLADYLFLGTLNADLQYSIHRSWTVQAGM